MKSGDDLHQAFRISLLPDGRLSSESLKKQMGGYRYKGEWQDQCLKFISFENGILTLRNTSNDESYTLQLQLKQNKLLVACNCGHDNKTICKHAYWALNEIHWKFGERYFTKFAPGGIMELAFKYPMHFDKKESNTGLDVFPRAELRSVYLLAPAVPIPDIKAILKLPESKSNLDNKQLSPLLSPAVHISEEKVIAYLIIISYRYEHLPSVIPIVGQLTAKKDAVKAFDNFTSGLQTINTTSLNDEQKILHKKCLALLKLTEKIPGELLADNLYSKRLDTLTAIFDQWAGVFSMLRAQPFVFTYILLGKRELRNKPRREYWLKSPLSARFPILSFVLADKGDNYRFSLQLQIDGMLLENVKTNMPLFITQDRETIFRLGSLRDACLVEWFNRSGGWITVFKEHFEAFKKEVLVPLQAHYTVQFS